MFDMVTSNFKVLMIDMIQAVNFSMIACWHAGIDTVTLYTWDLVKILHTSGLDFRKKPWGQLAPKFLDLAPKFYDLVPAQIFLSSKIFT